MATVTKPLALNESLNSTENTPRNIADVLADELDGIKQAISSQSGSGDGHIIQNSAGANMPQENTMQFTDSHLTDDNVGGKTVIENFKAVTEAEYSQQTEDGAYIITDGDGATIGEASEDYVRVTASGDTNKTLFNKLRDEIDFSKITNDSYIKRGSSIYKAFVISNDRTEVQFGLANAYTTSYIITIYLFSNADSQVRNCALGSSISNSDVSSSNVSDGTAVTLYYGNKKAVVDLQTTANRCLMPDGNTTVAQEFGSMFHILDVPIANTVISNYYGTVDTGLDTSIYTAIGIYEAGTWDENCNFTINYKGLSVHIKCRLQSYTIPNSMSALKLIYVKNALFN